MRFIKSTANRLISKEHNVVIYGPCEMGWFRVWAGKRYAICDTLKEAKDFAASIIKK